MKAIFPAICGALLLTSALPAAAQSTGANFGVGKQGAATSQVRPIDRINKIDSTRALGSTVGSQINQYRSTTPNAGTFVDRQSTSPSASRPMPWSQKGSTIGKTAPHLKQ